MNLNLFVFKTNKESKTLSYKMICYDLRFDAGATHLVVGPSASGKTYRTADIIRCKDNIIKDGNKIQNVIVFYQAWQPIYQEMQNEGLVNDFINKKPTNDEFISKVSDFKTCGGSIVVIDDFMGSIDADLVDIVTVSSRHYNTSTFILFQSLFPANKLARQISLNVKYMHVHKNPRENAQIKVLARQTNPDKYNWIVQAYHEVTKKPHSAFLIDVTQGCPEKLRFRSNYLPKEFPMRIFNAK